MKNQRLTLIHNYNAHLRKKIKDILCCIPGLQTIITTHSPHIVANTNFEKLRYLLLTQLADNAENVEIKNFHKDLKEKYTEIEEFQFLKQYLTIEAADLFFASKIIFIEGTSENMMLPYFISKYDNHMLKEETAKIEKGEIKDREYKPISTQNISILQVGSNAKVFRHFVEFLNIKTLIITDIDTTKLNEAIKRYSACPVDGSPDSTSNPTIRYYFKSPDFKEDRESLISGYYLLLIIQQSVYQIR